MPTDLPTRRSDKHPVFPYIAMAVGVASVLGMAVSVFNENKRIARDMLILQKLSEASHPPRTPDCPDEIWVSYEASPERSHMAGGCIVRPAAAFGPSISQ